MKVEKQVNKSDWDMTCMISEGKICIHLARDSDLAYTTEEDLLKISTNFFFVTDKGLVEIISLHRKWKNEKTKKILSWPKDYVQPGKKVYTLIKNC